MFDMLDDRDSATLEELRGSRDKSKKTVKTVLSRGKLNKKELDEMFLD